MKLPFHFKYASLLWSLISTLRAGSIIKLAFQQWTYENVSGIQVPWNFLINNESMAFFWLESFDSLVLVVLVPIKFGIQKTMDISTLDLTPKTNVRNVSNPQVFFSSNEIITKYYLKEA